MAGVDEAGRGPLAGPVVAATVILLNPEDLIGIYQAGAALFDLNDPAKLIARSEEPILSPYSPEESDGFVRNVIFPTGAVTDETGEHLLLFSGGADTVVTVTRLSMEDIFRTLEPKK